MKLQDQKEIIVDQVLVTQTELDFLRESNAIEREYDDIALFDAVKAWDYLRQQDDLNVIVILETHRILMRRRDTLEQKEKGHFRKCAVYIGGREGLSWHKIPEAMDDWLLNVATSIKVPGKNGEHIKLDHIEYERIHPFVDGNGRTGRMFYNWQRQKAGLPIHIIHEGPEQMKYYEWFQ